MYQQHHLYHTGWCITVRYREWCTSGTLGSPPAPPLSRATPVALAADDPRQERTMCSGDQRPATSNQQPATNPSVFHTFHPLINFCKRVHMSRTFRMWIYNGKLRTNPAKENACLALSCRICLVIWVLRWLRGSICNCTISKKRQEDVSHCIFQALCSCFHSKVVILYSTPCHYLHIIFLICYWHSLIIMETFISLLKTSNKNVRLGLWHLQFSL